MLKQFIKILRYELILSLRYSKEWLYPLAFFTVILIFFPIAFSPEKEFMQTYFAACIWIAAMLANLLSVQPIFYTDFEDGFIEQLVLSQWPLTFLLIPKLIAHWIMTQLPLIFLTLGMGIFFNTTFTASLLTAVSLLFGTPILMLIACTAVALSIGLRQQGFLLSLLVLPLSIPVLIFGVLINQQLQAGFSIMAALMFFAGLCILSLSLLPMVIATALKMSVSE